MKVTISVGGLFHAPPLIKYLMDHGVEVEFITSYPKYILKKRGIRASKIKTIWIKELLYHGYKKLFGKFPDNFLSSEVFDYIASYRISLDSDIYIIWAGFALHTIRRIKKKNPAAKIILERGSTHIEFQNEILIEEYKKFDILKTNIVPRGIIIKEKAEYNLIDYISIPTGFVQKTFIDKGIPNSKLFINPYGVDLSLFSQKREPEVPAGSFTVIFVGLFSVQKGAFSFLKIMDAFIGNSGIHFQIVGNIEPFLLNKISEYLNQGILSYQPSVPMNKLPEFYSRSSVFLLPSIQEGLAMVLLQAMASSLPVISTPNSGIGSIINDGEEGFIISPNDIISFVEKINYLIAFPEFRRKMGEKAKQKVENGYSWMDYGRRSLEFYTKIT